MLLTSIISGCSDAGINYETPEYAFEKRNQKPVRGCNVIDLKEYAASRLRLEAISLNKRTVRYKSKSVLAAVDGASCSLNKCSVIFNEPVVAVISDLSGEYYIKTESKTRLDMNNREITCKAA